MGRAWWRIHGTGRSNENTVYLSGAGHTARRYAAKPAGNGAGAGPCCAGGGSRYPGQRSLVNPHPCGSAFTADCRRGLGARAGASRRVAGYRQRAVHWRLSCGGYRRCAGLYGRAEAGGAARRSDGAGVSPRLRPDGDNGVDPAPGGKPDSGDRNLYR